MRYKDLDDFLKRGTAALAKGPLTPQQMDEVDRILGRG